MDRRRQDFFTYLVGIGLVVSQVVGYFLEMGDSPALLAVAGYCLGLPSIRKVQDNGRRNGDPMS